MISETQDFLSRNQTICLIGPFVFSPVKALVSIAQIIGGVAYLLFSLVAAVIFSERRKILKDSVIAALRNIGLGLLSLAYSIANFATLGLFGSCFETAKGCCCCCCCFKKLTRA